jgi:membrane protein
VVGVPLRRRLMRASNLIYEADEGRPLWKKLLVRLGVTVIKALVLVVSTAAVVLTGDLARQAGEPVGLGSTAVSFWSIAKWPVAVLVLVFLLALLYWAAPNVRHPGFRWLSPGAVLGRRVDRRLGGVRALRRQLRFLHVTYGTLRGVVAFLVWLWLTNMAVLLGPSSAPSWSGGARSKPVCPPTPSPSWSIATPPSWATVPDGSWRPVSFV